MASIVALSRQSVSPPHVAHDVVVAAVTPSARATALQASSIQMVHTDAVLHGLFREIAQQASSTTTAPPGSGNGGGGFSWKDAVDSFQALVTGLAIIVGGLFTYFKFFKDRVYRPRVNAAVIGGHADVGHDHFIVCKVTLENKGSTKLSIVQGQTGMLLFEGTPEDPFEPVQWGDEPVGKVLCFSKHAWIESDETIADEQMFSVPQGTTAVYRVRFRLQIDNPQPRWTARYREWRRKHSDAATDKDARQSPEEKEQEKENRRRRDEYSRQIDINAVTTVLPTDPWKTTSDERSKEDVGAREPERSA